MSSKPIKPVESDLRSVWPAVYSAANSDVRLVVYSAIESYVRSASVDSAIKSAVEEETQ